MYSNDQLDIDSTVFAVDCQNKAFRTGPNAFNVMLAKRTTSPWRPTDDVPLPAKLAVVIRVLDLFE